MAIDFPDSPSVGQTTVLGDKTWTWNGTVWNLVTSSGSDHGTLGGLQDDDHTHYALADGTRGTFEASGAVSTHEAASDPHTQYLLADGTRTATELTVSGDLTVDTDTLHVDSTNDRVGIGTTSPDNKLHVQIGASAAPASVPTSHMIIADSGEASDSGMAVYSSTTGNGYIRFGDSDSAAQGGFRYEHSADKMYFRTGGTDRGAIDSSGNVGIGTTTPSYKLHVRGGSSNDTTPEFVIDGNGNMAFHNGLGQGSFNGIVQAGDKGIIFSDGSVNTGEFVIAPWASGTGGMRIDSSGNTAFGGYVSHPRAFFRAYRRGNQGWSLTGVQTIVFENTVFNNGNNYSTSTGRFTAPVAGYYHLGAHFFKYTTYSNSTNTYWGIFTSNGYSTTTNHGTAGQDGGQSLNCIVYMGANDYADVQITSAGSTIQSYGTMSFNSFYGYLLSA